MNPTFAKQAHKRPERLEIPKLKKLTAPGKMVFLALHTREMKVQGTRFKRVPAFGYAIYWRRAKRKTKEAIENFEFTNSFDFFEWVTSKINKRETLYVYVFDVSHDFLALDGFRQLPDLSFTLTHIYHKMSTSILKFQDESRRLCVVDVQNYYPVSIEKLSHSFGVDLPPRPVTDEDPGEAKRYCEIKAELLRSVLFSLVKETVESGRGSLKLTVSGISNSIYRATFMKHRIITNHNPQVVEFEKAGYVGGYTSVCKLVQGGNPELYKLDVNSMYPSVMRDAKYPTKLLEFAKRMPVRHLERFLKGYLVIANVTLHARSAQYPIKGEWSNYYPVGDFDTTLNTASLQQALERDEIVKVNHVAVYEGDQIFKEFVEDTYTQKMKARNEQNYSQELFYKHIGNTLYGKFGQSGTKEVRVGDCSPDDFQIMEAYDPNSGDVWDEMHAGGSILFIYKQGETDYTSFAIAGHVTDYARLKLFELRDLAGVENVFYMDTDSLFVNREGLNNVKALVHPDVMGALKLEEQAPYFIGFAKKDYVFGDTRKLKGFDKDGKREEGNIFKAMQKVSIAGAVRQSLSGGAFWQEVNRRYNPFLMNEHIEEDGSVTPLRLPDEVEYIGQRKYTMRKIKQLANFILPQAQRSALQGWLFSE